VLVRNAEALEVTDAIDTLVVDKTGTLTLGGRAGRGRVPTGFAEDEVLRLAPRSRRGSEHRWPRRSSPARRNAGSRCPTARTLPRTPASGVTGSVEGRRRRSATSR
jgi:Cu+-exporting ATPase